MGRLHARKRAIGRHVEYRRARSGCHSRFGTVGRVMSEAWGCRSTMGSSTDFECSWIPTDTRTSRLLSSTFIGRCKRIHGGPAAWDVHTCWPDLASTPITFCKGVDGTAACAVVSIVVSIGSRKLLWIDQEEGQVARVVLELRALLRRLPSGRRMSPSLISVRSEVQIFPGPLRKPARSISTGGFSSSVRYEIWTADLAGPLSRRFGSSTRSRGQRRRGASAAMVSRSVCAVRAQLNLPRPIEKARLASMAKRAFHVFVVEIWTSDCQRRTKIAHSWRVKIAHSTEVTSLSSSCCPF